MQENSKLAAQVLAQESVIEGLREERKLWSKELAHQGKFAPLLGREGAGGLRQGAGSWLAGFSAPATNILSPLIPAPPVYITK